MDSPSNGERKPVTSTLTITLNHDTFHLDIKGEVPALEAALAMLDQAKRYFESQLRQQAVVALQQQMMEQRRGAALADKVSRNLH